MSEGKHRPIILATAAMFLLTAIWGSSFPIMKIAIESFTPLWFIAICFGAAGILMLLICIPRLKQLDR